MDDHVSIVVRADWQKKIQRRYVCPWENCDLHHLLSEHMGPEDRVQFAISLHKAW